jgi:hypothetical protein
MGSALRTRALGFRAFAGAITSPSTLQKVICKLLIPFAEPNNFLAQWTRRPPGLGFCIAQPLFARAAAP